MFVSFLHVSMESYLPLSLLSPSFFILSSFCLSFVPSLFLSFFLYFFRLFVRYCISFCLYFFISFFVSFFLSFFLPVVFSHYPYPCVLHFGYVFKRNMTKESETL